MITIFLATEAGTSICAYASESEIVPRVGETIQMPNNGQVWEVIAVQHRLAAPIYIREIRLDAVDCTVTLIGKGN